MICPACERDCPDDYMTKHHLRTKRVDKKATEFMCRDCHHYVHALFTNKQLADPDENLDNLDGLMLRPEYVKAVEFIKKLPPGRRVKIRQSNGRRRKR